MERGDVGGLELGGRSCARPSSVLGTPTCISASPFAPLPTRWSTPPPPPPPGAHSTSTHRAEIAVYEK